MRTQREVRQRAPWWLVGLLSLNLGLMSFYAQDEVTKQSVIRAWAQAAASLFQRPVTTVGGAGAGFFRRIGSLRNAAAENEELKRRVAEIETELRETRSARDENERLKGLLALKEEAGYGVVPARVIARDPSVWFSSIVINRGTTSGIDTGMPVVTREGIIGRIVSVSPVTAQVMLLTDERAAAGAVVGQLGASNALGAVRGIDKRGLLEMNFVSGLEPVKEGDYVVTTGQDGIYPPGLNVGTVVELSPGTATTPHGIRIRPSARLDSLEEVAVLQYKPPQRTPPTKTLPNVDRGKK
ncbi:MAG: rod shape-determining protein MreC [Pyrinomonadaceae bacterium]|nr:rod shape-determining protein MreC [Pyrinomonadaceae bacterium]